MKFFDLHCDTAYEMYKKELGLENDVLCTSLSQLSEFSPCAQVFAIWSDNDKEENEVYADFFKIYEHLKNEIDLHSDKCVLCKDKATLENDDRIKIILAAEGSRLLSGDLSRLLMLYEAGVRILTFGWKGVYQTCGSHDTEVGLTRLGFDLLSECERLGIIVDVSHLSEKGFWDIAAKATKPYIATHSNSFMHCPHSRNLNDIQFRTIVNAGGIVGINLYPVFVSSEYSDEQTHGLDLEKLTNTLCDHIEHFLSLDGAKALCIGADRDGIPRIDGYTQARYVHRIWENLEKRGIKEKVIADIFFNNAYNFMLKML